MYNKIIAAAFFIITLLVGINNSNAADVGEFFRSNLPVYRIVTAEGGNLSTTIDCATGNLTAVLTPTFQFSTNLPGGGITNWVFRSTVNTSDSGDVNGMYGPTADPSIILGNITTPPTEAAVDDIKNGTLISNNNAIAYPTSLTFGAGTLVIQDYTFDDVQDRYEIRSRGSGNRFINMNIETPVRTGTYNAMDSSGDYQAIVYFAFIPTP